MLTQSEIAAMQNAINAAEAHVVELERAAEGTGGPLGGLLFPSDAQRKATAARATLKALETVRNAAIEDGDHEQAMQVVENANRIANRTWAPPLETVGKAARDALPSPKTAGRWAKVLLVVVGLLAVAYIFGIARSFVPSLPATRRA